MKTFNSIVAETRARKHELTLGVEAGRQSPCTFRLSRPSHLLYSDKGKICIYFRLGSVAQVMIGEIVEMKLPDVHRVWAKGRRDVVEANAEQFHAPGPAAALPAEVVSDDGI